MDNSAAIDKFRETEERIDKEISDVNDFITDASKVGYLSDIYVEWDYVYNLEKNIESTDNKVTIVENEINKYEEELQISEDENLQLKNKVNVAYIIAGCSLGLSILQIILQVVGII
jgi:hypothetical protein